MSLALPPTSNNLDHEQRARLIRSTRKLGKLLGATPCLVEDTTPPPRRSTSSSHSRPAIPATFITPAKEWVYVALPSQTLASPSSSRSSSIDSQRPTHTELRSSSPSLKPTGGGTSSRSKSKPKPAPLLLRLQPIPVPSENQTPRPPSPASPTFSVLTVSAVPGPASTYSSASDLRRKRMAKLTRTLGENIPPELVFGADSQPPSKLAHTPSTTLRKKRSVLRHVSSKSHIGSITTNNSTASLPSTINQQERQVQPPLPLPLPNPPTPSSTSSSRQGSHRARSRSVHHPKSPIESIFPSIPPVPRKPSSPGLQIHVTTSASEDGHGTSAHQREHQSEHGHGHGRGHDVYTSFLDIPEWGKRKEREWSGEWNVRDMDDVVKGLRGLKGR